MHKYKFRVWNKEYGRWDHTALLEVNGDNELFHLEDPRGETTVIQQWTGILDINGKEIYEGDILKETHYDCKGTWLIPYKQGDLYEYEYIGVVYLPEIHPHSSFVSSFFDAYPVSYRTYPLNTTVGQTVGNHITKAPEVIGNMFDNPDMYVCGPNGPKTVD
jgi:uncharacterized phage protein (TIGR01671 family)